jgi:methylisocitrate lyase
VGFITLTEMADAVRRMASRVSIPVVADGDTGHGDLHNVARTVREFERAGAAGILLEDQVTPKRCGHFEGKALIPSPEMVLKLRAALDARADGDFVLIARTDACAVEGIDAAIERACRYAEAGADVCFVEAPESSEDLARIPREVPRPMLANMLTGGVTPILPVQELGRLGYKIVVCPIESLLVAGAAIRGLIATLLGTGRVDRVAEMMTFAEVKQVLGLDEVLGLRGRLGAP